MKTNDNGGIPPKARTEALLILIAVVISACFTIAVLAFPEVVQVLLGNATQTPLP